MVLGMIGTQGTARNEVSVQADFAPSSLIEARRSFPLTLLVVYRTFCYRRPIRHSTLVIIDRHLPAEGHYHAGLLVAAVGVGWGGEKPSSVLFHLDHVGRLPETGTSQINFTIDVASSAIVRDTKGYFSTLYS